MARHNPVVPHSVMSSIIMDDINSEQAQLLEAITNNDIDTVRDLVINQGVKPDYGGRGNLAVCRAAMEGRDSILTLLLDNGGEADVADMTDYMWMRRPIHMAASSGHIGCLDILLTREVDVNSRDSDHRTPLHWACTYGHTDTAEFLINRGASVNTAQIDGFTALHAASCLGHVEVCRRLIQHGADVNRSDRDNWTALHTSVCYGYIDVVTAILAAGASIHEHTSDAETAFHIACSSGHLDIAHLLYNHGAQINVRNINGYTPFHLSVYFAKHDLVHFLVTVYADMDTVNSAGQSPLYLAVLRGEQRIVQLMLEAGCRVDLPALLPLSSKLSEDVMGRIQYLGNNPRCLRDLCCIRVRTLLKYTMLEDVALLPIPTALKNLLMFKHLCEPL